MPVKPDVHIKEEPDGPVLKRCRTVSPAHALLPSVMEMIAALGPGAAPLPPPSAPAPGDYPSQGECLPHRGPWPWPCSPSPSLCEGAAAWLCWEGLDEAVDVDVGVASPGWAAGSPAGAGPPSQQFQRGPGPRHPPLLSQAPAS